ncbi:MAG: ABC transporter substrate-binding protein [Thermomicrobiales bacterium]
MSNEATRAGFAAALSRRTVFKLAAAAGVGATGIGAAPQAPEAAPAVAQEAAPLVIGRNIDDVITLDPQVAGEETYTIVMRGCYDTLVSTEPSDPGTLVPMLAESWEISDDALTYTFKLKSGVKFSTGNEMTADDFKFSFDRLRELKALPAYLMDPVASVEAPDPLTLVLTLKSPDAVFLTALCSSNFSVIDAKAAQEHGATDQPGADTADTAVEWLTQNSIGTGPYVLTGFTPKDRITMTANPSSWRQAAIPDVVIQAAADTSALKQMLEQGDVDLAWGLLNEQIAELRDNPDIAVATTPMLGFIALGMTCDPTRNEAVSKLEVRQAIKQSIDYDGIRSLQEGALTPPSLVPIGLPGALDPATQGFKRDVEAAKAAIAAAGYPDGFSASLATSATEIIGGIALALLAEKVQADLAEVGIDISLEVEDEEIFRPKYRAGDIDLVIGAWYVGYPNPFDLLDNWGPTGNVSINRFRWDAPDHPAVALLAEARKTVDAAARDELVRQAQLALQKDAPYTMLIQPVFSYPYRTSITGLVPNPTWNFDPSTISRT